MLRLSEGKPQAMTSISKLSRGLSIAFWIILWQIAAALIAEDIFLPSPLEVLRSLTGMIALPSFWLSVIFTLSRIMLGFLLSLVSASILAFASYRSAFIRILLDPLVRIARATPVASIVILILVWVSSQNLSVMISSLMVFPIVYENLLKGFDSTDSAMIEMADVYRIGYAKRIRYIYLPSVLPYLSSAISIALGLAWKSGIAAEVIGLPSGSIGERVYEAKIYLMTSELFAWTAVIVFLAFLFERFFLFLLRVITRRLV